MPVLKTLTTNMYCLRVSHGCSLHPLYGCVLSRSVCCTMYVSRFVCLVVCAKCCPGQCPPSCPRPAAAGYYVCVLQVYILTAKSVLAYRKSNRTLRAAFARYIMLHFSMKSVRLGSEWFNIYSLVHIGSSTMQRKRHDKQSRRD